MFKVPTMNKNEKEKDNTKNWKTFSVSLNRFELDDVSDSKIIDKLVLKLLISLRVSHECGVPCNQVIKLLDILTHPVK